MITALLDLVRTHPGLTVQQAADRLGVQASDVRNGLAHLQGLGLLQADQPLGPDAGAPACGTPPGCGDPTHAGAVRSACARCPLAERGCVPAGSRPTAWTTRGRSLPVICDRAGRS